jgi:hypothetical protein
VRLVVDEMMSLWAASLPGTRAGERLVRLLALFHD